MNRQGLGLPEGSRQPWLSNTNCCTPAHPAGLAAPLQAGTLLLLFVKRFVFSCSEKALGTLECFKSHLSSAEYTFPLSLVTPVTLSKDPSAVVIGGDTWAA